VSSTVRRRLQEAFLKATKGNHSRVVDEHIRITSIDRPSIPEDFCRFPCGKSSKVSEAPLSPPGHNDPLRSMNKCRRPRYPSRGPRHAPLALGKSGGKLRTQSLGPLIPEIRPRLGSDVESRRTEGGRGGTEGVTLGCACQCDRRIAILCQRFDEVVRGPYGGVYRKWIAFFDFIAMIGRELFGIWLPQIYIGYHCLLVVG
jgi:hypothetical protein